MQSISQNSLLQNGRGIDHLVVLVRDLQGATRDYAEVLGFSMSGVGRHPTGTQNTVARFQDETYLELLSVYDSNNAREAAEFLEKHEGGGAVGLSVESADATANFLRSKGLEPETGTGTIKLEETQNDVPTVLWKHVSLKSGTPIGDSIFFIEYLPERQAYRKRHPELYSQPSHTNTAMGLRSVWISTRDLEEGSKPFESIGFSIERKVGLPQMDAKGLEYKVGGGTILLLSPATAEGKTASFINQRPEAILGASIEVEDLSSVTDPLERNHVEFISYKGIYGQSILLSPERTHGLWMEMYQS